MSLLETLIEDDFGIKGRNRWKHSVEHDSLVFDADRDIFFWNSEGIFGNAFDYLVKVRGMDKAQASDFLKNSFGAFKEISEKEAYVQPYEKLIDAMWVNGIKTRDYWYRRCLTDSTIDRYRLGFYEGWSVIPIYDGGELVNFQKRRDEPDKKIHFWYKTGKVYLYNEGILPFTKNVYITEGLVDCILLNQMGLPSVCATGVNTWQPDWFSKFYNIESITYLADNDKAGMIGARSVANNLGTYRVKIVSFPDKEDKYDVGNYVQDGGTKESLLEHIAGNSKYLFELESPRKERSWTKKR